MNLRQSAAALVVAASLLVVAHSAAAISPLQSPLPEPTPTRARWRDLPATPTPDYSDAQHGRIRDTRYLLMLPMVSATTR